MPPKPNKEAAEVGNQLDENFGDEKPSERDIIKQGRSRLLTWERLRIQNEAKVFWDVYYNEKDQQEGTNNEDPKKKATQDAHIFWKVESDLKQKIDTDKIKKEANIFWDVYFELKDKEDAEDKVDTKPKTKVTPVEKAIDGVKSAEKIPKEKEGWFSALISMLTPFIAGAIAAIAPLILKIAAIAAAIGTAVGFILNLIPRLQNLNEKFKELKEGAEETKRINREVEATYEKKAKEMAAQGRAEEAVLTRLEKAENRIQSDRSEKVIEETTPGVGTFARKYFKLIGGPAGLLLDAVVEGNIKSNVRQFEAMEKKLLKPVQKAIAELEASSGLTDIRRQMQKEAGADPKAAQPQTPEWAAREKELIAKKEAREKVLFMKQMEAIAYFKKVDLTPEMQQAAYEGHLKQRAIDQKKAIEKAEKAYQNYLIVREKMEAKALKSKSPDGQPSVMKDSSGSHYGTGVAADFAWRPGMPPLRFSSQDDILGFKQGGPVSDFLRGGAAIGGFQLRAINRSNDYLKTLVDLTRGLLAKSGGGGSTNIVSVPAPGSSAGKDMPLSNPGVGIDSRGDFHNSTYSLNVPQVV